MEFQDKQWRNNHAVWQSVETSIHPNNLQPSSAAQHEGLDKNIRFRTAHLNYPGCSSPKGNEQMVLNFTRTAVRPRCPSVRPRFVRRASAGINNRGDRTAKACNAQVISPPGRSSARCADSGGRRTDSPLRSPESPQVPRGVRFPPKML